jgi:hypothetical protein
MFGCCVAVPDDVKGSAMRNLWRNARTNIVLNMMKKQGTTDPMQLHPDRMRLINGWLNKFMSERENELTQLQRRSSPAQQTADHQGQETTASESMEKMKTEKKKKQKKRNMKKRGLLRPEQEQRQQQQQQQQQQDVGQEQGQDSDQDQAKDANHAQEQQLDSEEEQELEKSRKKLKTDRGKQMHNKESSGDDTDQGTQGARMGSMVFLSSCRAEH